MLFLGCYQQSTAAMAPPSSQPEVLQRFPIYGKLGSFNISNGNLIAAMGAAIGAPSTQNLP